MERSDGTTGDWTVIASNLAATATSYTDRNVTAGATYSYEVEAFNGTAGSPDSNAALATVPYATPAAPSNLSATAAASPAGVSLSWTDNAANATSYTVERSDGTTGDWTVIAGNLSATATSYTDGNVTAGASYSYQVEAFDVTAGSSCSNAALATVPYATPAAPTKLSAKAVRFAGRRQSVLTDNTAIATAYVVERSVGTAGALDRHCQQSCCHGHQLYGQQGDGRGDATATRSRPLTARPARPSRTWRWPRCPTRPRRPRPIFRPRRPLRRPSVSLSWTDNDAIATAYVVERSVGTTGTWTVIASNLPPRPPATRTASMTAGGRTAIRSRRLTARPARPSPTWRWPRSPMRPRRPRRNFRPRPSTSTATVSLSWTDNASNATSYTVERSHGTTGVWIVIASNLPVDGHQLR